MSTFIVSRKSDLAQQIKFELKQTEIESRKEITKACKTCLLDEAEAREAEAQARKVEAEAQARIKLASSLMPKKQKRLLNYILKELILRQKKNLLPLRGAQYFLPRLTLNFFQTRVLELDVISLICA